jgi:hypothetical protein
MAGARGHRTLHAQWSQLLRLLMSGHHENGWGGLIGTFDKVVHVAARWVHR